MKESVSSKNIAVLVGGSDLFSGLRGISRGTLLIKQAIQPSFDDVLAVNYNYFLDFGRALAATKKHLQTAGEIGKLVLYGYSKGGDVVLRLARLLEELPVHLLVTIDTANGPWSDQIDRNIAGNVRSVINVFQGTPNLLRSHGAAVCANGKTAVSNIDLTGKVITGLKVTHGNIEMLMVPQVINWLAEKKIVHG